MRVITGTARGVPLKAPKGMDTRPTMDQVKEGIFSAIQFEVEGRRALDLFAGSGQLGIEALSRGASRAVFVDHRQDAAALVHENLRRTHFEDRGEVVCADFTQYLARRGALHLCGQGQGAHRRHPGEPEKDKAGRTCYGRAGRLQFLAENLPPAVRSDPSGPALCRSFFGNCPKNRIRN